MAQNSKQLKEREPIKVASMQEAREMVQEMANQRINNREIVKTKFLIDGEIMGLNPKIVKEWKKDSESKVDSKNQDPDIVTVFKLFKKGVSPTDVIIRTGLSFEFVSKAHEEFLQFEKRTIVPQWFEEYMYDLAYEIKDCSNLSEVYYSLKKAVKSHIELQKHVYPCLVCGKPVPLDGIALKAAIRFLILDKWQHMGCP